MKNDKLIDAIARLRDRETLSRVIDAAEARDATLANKESARLSKRVFSKFVHLKRGHVVYVHAPTGEYAPTTHKALFAKPLTIHKVYPRDRRIEVRVQGLKEAVKLRWSVLQKLRVSETPTPEALEYVLKGGQQ